ncbi:helix-turn-helix transcriptional regulator [Saccharospirillum sp. MSK14-1]|uniref:helix-turn-helix transcriptional regulator n=1 Tax=Saccharospirillum sp. MSK14-1 TaxID=1897632 RepID=UPI000D39E672
MNSLLKSYRLKAGISQFQLAAIAGFSDGQRRISHYESGNRKPGLTDCRILVSALNSAGVPCTLDDVFPPTQEHQKAS